MNRVAWAGRSSFVVTAAIGLLISSRAEAAELTIDCSRTQGTIRALHGVNTGPIHAGETLDLSAHYREAGIPLTRLHDCHWPSADVVDIHVVFPDSKADPARPESYAFDRTDDYIRAIVQTGSGIVYRLGESIEHSKRKYHVNPPTDPEKWAAICLGIIRHYNDGWARGFRHNIRYWEIWNEPENRPAMWTGNDEQYFRLYSTTAKAIKAAFPDVRVGGPAVGNIGQMTGDALEPSPFVRAFLDRCRRDSAPLDFFSWHTYIDDPRSLAQRAKAVRRLLDEYGFTKTESHLNEWNYLPSGDWGAMLSADGLVRQRWFERIGGPEGAAFTAAALIRLQDSPLDAANYYSADIQGFGLFNEFGVPKKPFFALKAFRAFIDAPKRLSVQGATAKGIAVLAGIAPTKDRVTILASNFTSREEVLRMQVTGLPWSGETGEETLLLDAKHNLTPIRSGNAHGSELRIEQKLEAFSVCVITLRSTTK